MFPFVVVSMCFVEANCRCIVLCPMSTGKPKRDENGNTVEDEFSQMPLIRQFFSRMLKEVDYYKRVCGVPRTLLWAVDGQSNKRNCLLTDDSWTVSREAAAWPSPISLHTASLYTCAGVDWRASSSWLDGKQMMWTSDICHKELLVWYTNCKDSDCDVEFIAYWVQELCGSCILFIFLDLKITTCTGRGCISQPCKH